MQDWIPLITGSGGCLVALVIAVWAFASGKIHSDAEFQEKVAEIKDLKTALETERSTNNELARAGGVTNKLIGALVEVATDRHPELDRHHEGARRDGGLTAGDLGL